MDLLGLEAVVEYMVVDGIVSLLAVADDMDVDMVLEIAPFLPNIHLRHSYSNLFMSLNMLTNDLNNLWCYNLKRIHYSLYADG